MDRIAFFWIGEDLSTPEMLVKSILMVYGKDVEIVQLTDLTTAKIDGVTQCYRKKLSLDIMLARLEAYALIPFDNKFTFFIDADSLLLNRINLNSFNKKYNHFVKRVFSDAVMNHLYPEYYPEFEGKSPNEVMPIMFGAMAVLNAPTLFGDLREICWSLPNRFHRWYGDQVSLFIKSKAEKSKFKYVDGNQYMKIISQALSKGDLLTLRNSGVKLVTFKGPIAKNFLGSSFSNL